VIHYVSGEVNGNPFLLYRSEILTSQQKKYSENLILENPVFETETKLLFLSSAAADLSFSNFKNVNKFHG
jgi:hypothetical protein